MRLRHALLALAAAIALPSPLHAERGSDGVVRIIYWQAPSTMNPYLSGGIKDREAASLVLEPLARYDQDGRLVPWLAERVPTPENGGVGADHRSITWTIKDGLLWSDGAPVTSADIRFSWQYCTAEGMGCAQAELFNDVIDVETPDARTAIVRFGAPKPFPYGPFVGARSPILQRVQFAGCLGSGALECTEANFSPVGTGPFVVTDFRANDAIRLEANPNYRDPGKPAFARVLFKGGGDASGAARAVLETGEFDYAANLQVAPELLTRMASAGKGAIVSAFGTLVEQIVFNLTDPSPGGDRPSTTHHPHPALTDRAVRRALSMAIDRPLLAEIGYGSAGRPTCNLVTAPERQASTANDGCLVQDIEGANALLDAAGWIDSDGDGIRDRNGVKLSLLFQTSTNAVRQDFQALIKQWWSEIGVETELRSIDAAVFFGGDPGSPDTLQKFRADVQMFANNFDGTDPETYLANWRCREIPTPETQWQGNNVGRYCSDAYDALAARMALTAEPEQRAALARKMNDMLVQDFVVLPLVDRGRVSAHAGSLGGVVMNAWDSELWNVADWVRAE